MKILNSDQVREADKLTIERQHLATAELMERAAVNCTWWLTQRFKEETSFIIICGNGNNGGDGLAIARLLKNKFSTISVVIIGDENKRTEDNKLNLERLKSIGIDVSVLNENEELHDFYGGSVIIDAILGNGLNRSVSGFLAEIMKQINSSGAFVVSIDSPSGFFNEMPMPENALAVEADITLCLQAPRLMYFFPESYRYTGDWEVVNIGLDEEYIARQDGSFHYVTLKDIQPLLPAPRHKFSHKGTYGHALLIGGGYGKTGAILLSAKACMRAGAGLTSIYAPVCSMIPLQSAVPEGMVISGDQEKWLSGTINPEHFSALGFGPGAGKHDDTAKLLKHLLQDTKQPIVIDADGLNILADNPTWLAFLPENTVLTPHPGEIDRLAGTPAKSGYDRFNKALEISLKSNAVIVLKGAFTACIFPDGTVFFNSTGNPGMATGGSGDVLTGILTGLLAQNIPVKSAVLTGVYLHGLAGDIAAKEKTETGLVAGDLIEKIGDAWKEIYL